MTPTVRPNDQLADHPKTNKPTDEHRLQGHGQKSIFCLSVSSFIRQVSVSGFQLVLLFCCDQFFFKDDTEAGLKNMEKASNAAADFIDDNEQHMQESEEIFYL